MREDLTPGKELRLLPLDGAGGFGGDVQDDAVDVADLVGDAGGDAGEEVVREAAPVGGHGVLAADRAEDHRVAVGAAVALHAYRADVGQQDYRELPDVAVQAGGGYLGADDGVGGPEYVEAVGGDGADDADREAGAGEGVAPDDGFGEAQLSADAADFVLEQGAQRFDQF